MNSADILFQFQSTDASATLTDGHLVFTAPEKGQTMINQMLACPSSGGGSNFYRIYHAGPEDTPSVSNMIFYAGTSATAKNATGIILNTKIVMNSGDRIYCQLHSGDGVTITAYGLMPGNVAPVQDAYQSQSAEVMLPGSVGLDTGMGTVLERVRSSSRKGY
jgi:hypothetical protein